MSWSPSQSEVVSGDAGIDSSRDLSILIVDDDPIAIRLIREMLSDYRNLRFATNGTDALRLAREMPPDLLLLDGQMPGQDGFEICAIVKADSQLEQVPVIFVTAHDDLDFEARALALGAADFIAKPISMVRLRLRVKLHLQLKQQLDALRHLAATDTTTGVANRRKLDETLTSEWIRAERTGQPLSLLLVDVDFFKGFNDSYGHPAGDRCLRTVAQVISNAARRPHDLAGRFGGEEFAIVLPHTDAEGAMRVGATVRDLLATAAIPHRSSSVSPHVTVSIGAASMRPRALIADADRPDPGAPAREHQLVDAADRALYAAKRNGRDRAELAPSNPEPTG